jgi:hypothetical protein
MYTLPRSNYRKPSLLVNDRGQAYAMGINPVSHRRRIQQELQALGAVKYNMWLPETHALPRIIRPDEQLHGVVYGRYKQKGRYGQEANTLSSGRGMLVVTDVRVLFIDKKPLFLRCDEIPREIISGVTYAKVGFAGTVAMHTRAGDFTIRTFNDRCAKLFVESLEAICFEQKNMGVIHLKPQPKR